MRRNACILSLLLTTLLGITTNTHAAGFALIEQSVSGMGNAFAGVAASAEDASTIFFNPAGLAYLPDNQLVVAAHAIRPSAEVSNNGTTGVLGTAINSSNGGDAGDWAFLPNFYYAKAVSDSVKLGIGVNAPFGLKTEYDNGWTGRYHALKSELKTININPTIAFKLNDNVSFGAGVSYQRIEAELTKAVDFGSICAARVGVGPCTAAGLTATSDDGKSGFKGDDWSWGFNLGTIIQATPFTRVGLAYRSGIKHKLEGSAVISGEEQFDALLGVGVPLAAVNALKAAFPNSNVQAKADLPATLSASVYHKANDRLDLMADITWTGWNSFDVLRVVRTSGALSGNTVDVQPEYWKNTMRYSLGASYRYDDNLKLRAGLAYDESPISPHWLTPRIPDGGRTWLAFGANYKLAPNSAIDVGYTHIFVRDVNIDTSAQAAEIAKLGGSSAAGILKGNYDSNVNMLSIQFTHTF